MRAFIIMLAIAALIACKRETPQTETQSESSVAVDSATQESKDVATSTPVPSPSQGHDYTFLTHELFKVGGAVMSSAKNKGENPYTGNWVDFFPDGTYKWGKQKEVLHSGEWSYNDKEEVLQMKATSGEPTRSEWKVMHNDQMVVLLGTSTFGNSSVQIQLIRTNTIPD